MAGFKHAKLLCFCRQYPPLNQQPNKMLRTFRGLKEKQMLHVAFQNTALSCSKMRLFSFSAVRKYETIKLRENGNNKDLKEDATKIFNNAIKAVRPQQMVENVLKYKAISSILSVRDQQFKVKHNVFVVGMGSAVLGMARVVEDLLGDHIVSGVISIPLGLQEQIKTVGDASEILLSANSNIKVYEGAENNEMDEAALNASKAMHNLVTHLSEKDILIVLCSGGGSALCPLPRPPITFEDLRTMSRLLTQSGATAEELNTVLKNIEVLKGGGLAVEAQPARVVSLILSSMIGDPVELIASGPTCLSEPTPKHSQVIIKRFGLMSKIPESIRKFLEREVKQLEIAQAQEIHGPSVSPPQEGALKRNVQNIIVGNNSLAREGAARKAFELGYLPLILTEIFTGEAREMGKLSAKLMKFIMICFDRKASWEPNSDLAMLEVELVAGGINKVWMNFIASEVDRAHNMCKDLCVIIGGDTTVDVRGSGVGGKNLETSLAAAIQMHKDLREKELSVGETSMCLLSADSDGWDGQTGVAGAAVDQNFLDSVEESGLDMEEYLENNDSYTLFKKIDASRNLVRSTVVGINIMDMVVLLVQRPRD